MRLTKTRQGLVGGVVDHLLDDVQGLSVRVYMPGRCLTGSSPFRTRMDASPYRRAKKHWMKLQGFAEPWGGIL